MVVDEEEEDEVEDLGEKDKSKEKVVEEEELEGETNKPEKEEPSEGEFIWRLGKELMIEEATMHPLPVSYPQRLKRDQQEIKSQ